MSIGAASAFPLTWKEMNQNGVVYPMVVGGMTYRQWLIGQAIAGLCADPNISNIGQTAISIADEVIERLNSELPK